MQATTIKIEGNILHELKTIIPKEKTLTAFVREVLEKEIRRKKMAHAAGVYAQFLKNNPEEEGWLKNWEASELSTPPKKVRKRKSP